jgi:N6-adenosine-specific RNA methylase IME4
MFARTKRAGWDAYGNEIEKFTRDQTEDLFKF